MPTDASQHFGRAARPSDHPVLALRGRQIDAGAPPDGLGPVAELLGLGHDARAAPGEVDGQDYRFLTEPAFKKHGRRRRDAGTRPCLRQLLRLARGAGAAEAIEAGRDVLFDIDWQGAQQIRNSASGPAHAVDLHPAALDPRVAPQARQPGPGRSPKSSPSACRKAGTRSAIGTAMTMFWSTTTSTRPSGCAPSSPPSA
jgi:hypothetical protein